MKSNFISNEIASFSELKELFTTAQPFPHVVIDNFLQKDVFNKLLFEFEDFYKNKSKEGRLYSTQAESNKWSSQGLDLPPYLKEIGDYLASDEILSFLNQVTGFNNLKSVSGYNSKDIGFFSLMKKGSYLGPHIDHMFDMTGNAGYHVLNIILYISKDWDPNWGGNTFLKNRNTSKYSSVEFKPNRALIFMHSPLSEHGTSELSESSKNDRMTIYFDYYSSDLNPYKHLNLKFNMAKSPHLFFLPKLSDYFKLNNRKYLSFFIRHRIEQIKYYFKIK